MVKKWLSWINLVTGGLLVAFVFAALFLWMTGRGEIPSPEVLPKKMDLPKGSFKLSKEAYDKIGDPVLSLKFSPVSMQLPDLRRYLVYYGKNGRPDADPAHPHMFFSFVGNKNPSSVDPGHRLYLWYDRKQTPPQYVFSPQNAETPLWLEANATGNEAIVNVGMKDENGNIVKDPQAYAQFTLPEKEFVRYGGTAWEIGTFRVDGTLMARQKARWYGQDRFLETHGGEEYAKFTGKQRIDFGEGEDAYSVFVGPGDTMIWKNRWVVVDPGSDSRGFPLMVIKKVDERLMNLELWDVDGKGKITINVLKSTEAWMPQNLQQSFKFVGARTRTQFVFEINKERMLLSPKDWLLLTDDGWKKLSTPEEIDEFVDRKITGPLFIFDGIQRVEDQQVLTGTVFNSSRTEMQPVELSVQQSGISKTSSSNTKIDESKKGQGSAPNISDTDEDDDF
jgi:hypothetical protein